MSIACGVYMYQDVWRPLELGTMQM